MVANCCTLLPMEYSGCTGGLYCFESSPLVASCTFVYNSAIRDWASGGALRCFSAASPAVVNCTFYSNTVLGDPESGSAIYAGSTASLATVENTIIAAGLGGRAVGCSSGGAVTLMCCDLHGNEGGDWVGCIADQLGLDGNICADPLFCDPGSGDFCLELDSPCAPFSLPNPECDLVGAWGVCGQTAPTALFAGTPVRGAAPLTVRFFDISAGDPSSWNWDFGDYTGPSTEQNPVHEYSSPGTYTVSLTASNGSGSDTETKDDYITVLPAAGGTVHVHQMSAWRSNKGPHYFGECVAYIYDQHNQPVAGAEVEVFVTGPTGGTFTEITGEHGRAWFKTPRTRNPVGEWCFTVTAVTHTGYTYDPSANNVTMPVCESRSAQGPGAPSEQQFSLVVPSGRVDTELGTQEIGFTLPEATHVKLDVFDVTGGKVATLVDGWRGAGSHAVQVDASGLRSGVYFARLHAGERYETRRITVVR